MYGLKCIRLLYTNAHVPVKRNWLVIILLLAHRNLRTSVFLFFFMRTPSSTNRETSRIRCLPRNGLRTLKNFQDRCDDDVSSSERSFASNGFSYYSRKGARDDFYSILCRYTRLVGGLKFSSFFFFVHTISFEKSKSPTWVGHRGRRRFSGA